MGLNNELNYALQEDNEEIFGDQSESTVNVNLAEDTIIKQGITLPKSESEWKTANSFFHANLPIEDMNTDGDFKGAVPCLLRELTTVREVVYKQCSHMRRDCPCSTCGRPIFQLEFFCPVIYSPTKPKK